MKIFSKTLLLTLTSLSLFGCANQQEASQSSQELVHVSEEAVKEELQQDLIGWQRYFTKIQNIYEKGLSGYLHLEANGRAVLNRSGDEFIAYRNGLPLTANYEMSTYQGGEEVGSYVFPKTGDDFEIISVTPEFELDFQLSSEELERVTGKTGETSFHLYGYQTTEGHLVLTDGDQSDPQVYVYQSDEEASYTVASDKTAIYQSPEFGAEVIGTLEKGRAVVTSGSLFGEVKDGMKQWFEVQVEEAVGYIWSGDLEMALRPFTENYFASSEQEPSSGVEWTDVQSVALAEAMDFFGREMGQVPYVKTDKPEQLILVSGESFDGYQILDSYHYQSGSTSHRYFFVINPSGQPEVLYSTGGTSVKSTENTLLPKLYQDALNGIVYTSPGVMIQQVSGGNVASLAGKWVNGQGTDWIINSKGNLVTGESIRLSEAIFNEEGILLELVDGSKTSTVLLIPQGAPHGQSDTSKNRLLLYDKGLPATVADYFYYQD